MRKVELPKVGGSSRRSEQEHEEHQDTKTRREDVAAIWEAGTLNLGSGVGSPESGVGSQESSPDSYRDVNGESATGSR